MSVKSFASPDSCLVKLFKLSKAALLRFFVEQFITVGWRALFSLMKLDTEVPLLGLLNAIFFKEPMDSLFRAEASL